MVDRSEEGGPGPPVTLVISGPIGLAEAPRWHDALCAAGSGGRDVRLDLATSGPWDLAGLQLLLSALATGRHGGPAVRLARVPRVCLEVARRAGVEDRLAEAVESRID